MNITAPTVFVVDDEECVRRAISRILRLAGFNTLTFESSAEFLAARVSKTEGCLLLDMAMPGSSGLELQQALEARGASWPIVFLTGRADVPMTVQAMKQGAVDFLTKPVNEETLVSAVHAAIDKDRQRRQAAAETEGFRQRLATLTPRQREVMSHVVAGRLNKQIAADIGTVEKTVKVHRAAVMKKLQVESLAELVRLTERLKGQDSTRTPPELVAGGVRATIHAGLRH